MHVELQAITHGARRPSQGALARHREVLRLRHPGECPPLQAHEKHLAPRLTNPGLPQLPTSIEGLSVLDLGCGSGRDCYIASALVGPQGSVTGIDMTAEQLTTAREHIGAFTADLGYDKPNLRFLEGTLWSVSEDGRARRSAEPPALLPPPSRRGDSSSAACPLFPQG